MNSAPQEWKIYTGLLPTDVGGLGAMPMFSSLHNAWYSRPAGYSRALRMPAAEATQLGATGDAQATAQVLLAYLAAHGVPSVHAVLPVVKSFQNAWNATASSPSVMSVDGKYNAATATALAVTLQANVPAPNGKEFGPGWMFVNLNGASGETLGDANQDGLDLTMQDRANTLLSDFNGGSVTSAPNGDVTNFQIAWNNSTPGHSMTLAVDGKYGPLTAQALAKALVWVGPNGNVVGGTAPNGFHYGSGGGGGGGSPTPSPTPGNNSQSVVVSPSTGSNSTAAWILGGALVAAAGIAGYAWYHKGGGKAMIHGHRQAHHTRHAHR